MQPLALSWEELATERDLIGQVLTFCAFLGGIAIAGLVQVLVDGQQFIESAEFIGSEMGLGTSNEASRAVILDAVFWLLTATAGASLSGAFFAVLGFSSYSRMCGAIDRLRTDPDHIAWRAQHVAGKYATFHVFHIACRALAVCAMSFALLLVCFIFTLAVSAMWLAVLAVVPMLLIPLWADRALRRRLVKQHNGVRLANDSWSWEGDGRYLPLSRAGYAEARRATEAGRMMQAGVGHEAGVDSARPGAGASAPVDPSKIS